MKHFLLTRFNLVLWPRNKFGVRFDTSDWLVHRMDLFERYCAPSIAAQTCKDFEWILLMDERTPDWCRERIAKLRDSIPQISPVYVERSRSRQFPMVFCEEVRKRSRDAGRVITTYLDNDDAIAFDFVEDVHRMASQADCNTIISFVRGFQYFSDIRFATEILYPNNHFISLVEDAGSCRTVYGYGSHISLGKVSCLKIMEVDTPKWSEVIHSQNVDNDVKMTFHTGICKDLSQLTRLFGHHFELDNHYFGKFFRCWLPAALRHSYIRMKQKLTGRNWWE